MIARSASEAANAMRGVPELTCSQQRSSLPARLDVRFWFGRLVVGHDSEPIACRHGILDGDRRVAAFVVDQLFIMALSSVRSYLCDTRAVIRVATVFPLIETNNEVGVLDQVAVSDYKWVARHLCFLDVALGIHLLRQFDANGGGRNAGGDETFKHHVAAWFD